MAHHSSHVEQLPSQTDSVRPLGVLALIVFLTIDGVERAIEVAYGLSLTDEQITARAQVFETPALVSCFWLGANWLLAALLALRSWAGRIWTQCLFGIHLFYLFHMIAFRFPEGWLYVNAWSRTQIAASVIFDVLAIAYLNSLRARNHLCN